jgi:hypothetical protein
VTQTKSPTDLTEREARIQVSSSEERAASQAVLPELQSLAPGVPIDLDAITAKISIQERMVGIEGGRTDIALRRLMAIGLLSLFVLNTLGALFVVFLVGFGKMSLTDKVIMSVLGATVIQAATMLAIVVRYLFPTK